MAKGKIYTGITIDNEMLRIARIRVKSGSVTLVNLDQVRLVERLQRAEVQTDMKKEVFDEMDVDDTVDDTIFGIDDILDEDISDGDDDFELDLEDLESDIDLDLDFDQLEENADDMIGVDMTEEAGTPSTNEMLMYNILSSIDGKRVDLGLGIPSGNTIYQILKDVDFNDTKKKDLKVVIEDRLEAFHGVVKGEDFYSYHIREDGSMLLASLDDEPSILGLVNRTQDMYTGKLFIGEMIPEEMILLGLINSNYELESDTITGVIQFGDTQSRVIFLKGNQLWIVSPIITEGTSSKKFLNTIFSKILFQLDTGEVPNLDRIIICNNTVGEPAIEFFEDRFSDVNVSEFKFSEDLFDTEITSERSIASFTSTIGAAWAASGVTDKMFPGISFLPKYVRDRQKVFQLQWHGFLLLLLIFATPFALNLFYTNNLNTINILENDISRMESSIQALEPIVQDYNRISAEMTNIQGSLALLDTLSKGTLTWSTNFELLNSGVDQLNTLWVTSLSAEDDDGMITLRGIATDRQTIAQLADLFDSATLNEVSSTTIREKEVYSFQYIIRRVVSDETEYNPSSTQGIQELVGE